MSLFNSEIFFLVSFHYQFGSMVCFYNFSPSILHSRAELGVLASDIGPQLLPLLQEVSLSFFLCADVWIIVFHGLDAEVV